MSSSSEFKHWMLLLFLSVIWGTSFILIKKSLLAFTPIEVATLRVGISGLAFAPFFIRLVKKLEWRRWWFYLVISLTGSGIPAILYSTAQTKLSSATSGVLNSMTPIFALLIGIFIFRNSTSRIQIAGTFLGFLGVSFLILLDQPADSHQSNTVLYGGLIILGTVLYGLNVNLIQEFFQKVSPMELTTFSFFLLGFPVALIIPFTTIPNKIFTHPQGFESLASVSGLAIVSTAMAIIIFYRLVQETSAVFGSSVAYFIPVVALVWGAVDGEFIGWMHVVSMLAILIGVFMIRKGQVTNRA